MTAAWILSALSNAVGTLIVDNLVKHVECHIRYLFRMNKIVEEPHEQEKNLTKEQSQVQPDVNEAKRQIQTQVIEKEVEDWLTKVEKVLNDAQSLEGRIQENRCLGWCPNWSWRYQLSKQIEQKTMAITKLVDSSKFERYGHRAELFGIEFLGSEGYLASKSAKNAFKNIMEALKEEGVNMIGVWGMGGVGKTALVREVGKEAKSSQLFDSVINVVVSNTPNSGKVQDMIADTTKKNGCC